MPNQTDQTYAFVNDNPLNATDPLGLKGSLGSGGFSTNPKMCAAQLKAVLNALKKASADSSGQRNDCFWRTFETHITGPKSSQTTAKWIEHVC